MGLPALDAVMEDWVCAPVFGDRANDNLRPTTPSLEGINQAIDEFRRAAEQWLQRLKSGAARLEQTFAELANTDPILAHQLAAQLL